MRLISCKWLLQCDNRKHDESNRKCEARTHNYLSRSTLCAEQETEGNRDSASSDQCRPHHGGHASGSAAQQPQPALVTQVVQLCYRMRIPSALLIAFGLKLIVAFPELNIRVPDLWA